jgi:hypothetical protein
VVKFPSFFVNEIAALSFGEAKTPYALFAYFFMSKNTATMMIVPCTSNW